MSRQKPFLLLIAIFSLLLAACEDYVAPEPLKKERVRGTLEEPLHLVLAIDLGTMRDGSGWQRLLADIEREGDYVSLDLSKCTMDGTVFNIGISTGATATGKNKIVMLILPDTVTAIGFWSFGSFSNLKSLRGAGLVSVGDWAFHGCKNLTEIHSESLTYIGSNAFYECRNLNTINLSANAIVSGSAFAYCENLKFVVNGSGPLSVIEDGRALVQDNTELVSFPSAKGSVTLPESITSIGSSAFARCTELTNLALHESLKSIGSFAFHGCEGFTEIVLPGGLERMGGGAFRLCSNLDAVTSHAAVPPEILSVWLDIFDYYNNLQQIRVPAGSVDAYKAAKGWSPYADIITAIE